jgi:hypothetical protein
MSQPHLNTVRSLKLEVLNREDMNSLSRELSRAGIMNRTREETSPRIEHYVVIEGSYGELLDRSSGILTVEGTLEEIKVTFEEMLSEWGVGESRDVGGVFDESDLNRLTLLSALLQAGAVEENDGKLILLERPNLENLHLELRFPIDEVEEELEVLEERFNPGMITEFTLEKHYYVEVIEVDRELIESALEIAKEYATEESIVDAMFSGIARSVLADIILELAKEHKKKNELIEALMEREPITIEGEKERINLYFDEDAIEDFLKELQSLGYLKVKGNRIWA